MEKVGGRGEEKMKGDKSPGSRVTSEKLV